MVVVDLLTSGPTKRNTCTFMKPSILPFLQLLHTDVPNSCSVNACLNLLGRVVWTFFFSPLLSLLFLPLSGRWPDID